MWSQSDFRFRKLTTVRSLHLKCMELMERHLIGGYCNHQGSVPGTGGKEHAASAGDVREAVHLWVEGLEEMQPPPVSSAWRSPGQRSLMTKSEIRLYKSWLPWQVKLNFYVIIEAVRLGSRGHLRTLWRNSLRGVRGDRYVHILPWKWKNEEEGRIR